MRLLLLILTLAAALPAQLSPYAKSADHPANRIFRATYVVEATPTKVGAALPTEHGGDPDFFVPKWYFRSRPGTPSDRSTFGGDARQLPRERFTATESRDVKNALDELAGPQLSALRDQPRLAVYLQYDLLRLARRLIDTKANPELLPHLRAAAQRLALPARSLQGDRLTTFELDAIAPHLTDCVTEDLVEVQRRSTRLFDAERTGLWSRVWLTIPAGRRFTAEALLTAIAKSSRDQPVAVPLGATAVLVQGIVAVDDAGIPRATGLVTDVRLQRFTNRDPLAATNPTTTRDGVDLAQWLLRRQAVRSAGEEPISFAAFSAIPMHQPELFRDYGSRKHTTYFAQCSLCHRRTSTPDQHLAGFSVLRRSANPRRAEPGARERQAERELGKFLTVLRAR